MKSATIVPAAPRSRLIVALTVVVGLDIALLTGLRIGGSAGPLELAGQALLVVAFMALALVDLRVATAVAVLELVVAGASGHWTVLGVGLYGRLVLDGIVFAVAVIQLVRRAGWNGLRLGRYSVHGLALALLIPGIWIPLGLINGNSLHDAFADGNGYHFMAFGLVVAALSLGGDLAWLRKWVFVACSITALLTVALAAAVWSGAISLGTLGQVLFDRLDMGGGLSSGTTALRVYLGSGLYLQVGLILSLWELLQKPRRLRGWAILVLFVVALLATNTRGYWLGAVIGASTVVSIGLASPRRIAAVALAATILIGAGSAVLTLSGSSVPSYVFGRVASIFLVEPPGGSLGGNDPGVWSNGIKVVQAQVLVGHITERPVLGWGFGAVAPDYPYGQSYSYELAYIALAYKTGIVGLLLFMSFPLRLLLDAIRGRLGRLPMPPGMTRREAAVPIAILSSVLVVGATNPYLGAAFGLASIILCIAWLDPFEVRPQPAATEPTAT